MTNLSGSLPKIEMLIIYCCCIHEINLQVNPIFVFNVSTNNFCIQSTNDNPLFLTTRGDGGLFDTSYIVSLLTVDISRYRMDLIVQVLVGSDNRYSLVGKRKLEERT